jgi:glycosyltransferase involved in cell wall biosynthesis
MRVLLVTYHYPPDPAVGAVRAGRISQAVTDAGHQVVVVSVAMAGLDVSGPTAPVHRVRQLPNPKDLMDGLRRLLRIRKRQVARLAQTAQATGWVVPSHLPGWKRFLLALAYLPDDRQGFILPALVRSLGIMMRGVDLLYTSGPPHSAHVVGLLLKWLTGVRWAAEFRDPWTDNAVPPRSSISKRAFAIEAWIERQVLAGADHVIAVSDAAARIFEEKTRRRGSGLVVVVRNGIERLELEPPPRRDGIRVIYLGNLYHGRDPRPFFRALADLRAAGDQGIVGLSVDLYGHCRRFRGGFTEDAVEELGLGTIVHVHDAVDRDEVASIMKNADLLLLFAQQQPLQVPAKLYEYLGARRPILAFADADGETAEMLRRIGGHFIIPTNLLDDRFSVETVVHKALHCARRKLETNDALLEEWSSSGQMSRLIDVVEKPANRSSP